MSSTAWKLVTTFTYDAQGDVTSRLRQGYAGNTAVSETYSFTYNALGQLTGVDGPRGDVNDTLTLTYYANTANQGNMYGWTENRSFWPSTQARVPGCISM